MADLSARDRWYRHGGPARVIPSTGALRWVNVYEVLVGWTAEPKTSKVIASTLDQLNEISQGIFDPSRN